MPSAIEPITLALPYRLGSVNCYLITTATGYVLIDTGSTNQRAALEQALRKAGCQPGDLKLIILTHGDFDHTGNAAYLRQKFHAPVALHPADFAMLARGDMFASRCGLPFHSHRAGGTLSGRQIRGTIPEVRCDSPPLDWSQTEVVVNSAITRQEVT